MSSSPGVAKAFPCGVEGFGQDARVGGDGHEVGVADPAGQGVHVDVCGDARSSGLTEIDAEVQAGGVVDGAQDRFRTLGQGDHLLGLFVRERGERVQMPVGDDEDVACGVREGVEAEEAGGFAGKDVGGLLGVFSGHALVDGVVDGGDHVAEDAVVILGAGHGPRIERGGYTGAGGVFGAADVVVAPGSPETIHGTKYTGCGGEGA